MASKMSFDKFHNIVNGQQRDAEKHYNGVNPFTQEKLWPVPTATEKDLEEAVTAANAAFKKWSRTDVAERRKALQSLAQSVMAEKAEWAKLLAVETGKSQMLAEGETDACYGFITTISNLELPEHKTHDDDDVTVVTKYVPLGVVAGIVPWNFPVLLGSAKLAAALLTGNTIILKPSPYTPYSMLKLAEAAQPFFPPGVVQALGGDDNLGPWMTKHPDIAKISFTGSSATGKKVMAAAAPTLKRVTLELGGNDASIVCADVDLDKVVPTVTYSAFQHGGQVCVASKRLYVHQSIYEPFMEKFVAEAKKLQHGQGYMSAIQNGMQWDKVKEIYADCVEQKYEFALGDGSFPSNDKTGNFAPPTIVARPPEKSRIVQEEPFGPIVPVLTWTDEAEVIERANDSDQGLGATVYCKDPKTAERIANQLEAGSVWINGGVKPIPSALFGGVKQSGIGGEWGPLGLLSYCNPRTIHTAKKY